MWYKYVLQGYCLELRSSHAWGIFWRKNYVSREQEIDVWCVQRTQYWTSPQILGTGHIRPAQVVTWDYSGDALTQLRSISPRHLSSGVSNHTGKEETNSLQRGHRLLETPQVPGTLSRGYRAHQPQVNTSFSNSYFTPPQNFLAMSFALYFMWNKYLCFIPSEAKCENIREVEYDGGWSRCCLCLSHHGLTSLLWPLAGS